jgi:glycosyltransferase involved in cell wall biosynthesis
VDIVKNGINGRLVERGNTGALSRAIYELLQDRELRHRWGKAALAWAQNNFSYGKNATAHIMLYKRLLQVKTDSF